MIGPGRSLAGLLPVSLVEGLLLGQAAPRGGKQGHGPSFLLPSLYLVAALLAGAALIALVGRWMKRREQTERLSPSDQLAQYRSLYEKGEISQEEFQQLRSLLGGRIRATAARAPSPPPQGAAEDRKEVEKPEPPAAPHNPSGPSQPPETGIKPG